MFDPDFFDEEYPLVLPSIAQLGLALGQAWEPNPEIQGCEAGADAWQDPRSPIQQLLETFDLEDDIEQRAQVAHWNTTELPENKATHDTLAADAANREGALSSTARELRGLPDQEIAAEEARLVRAAAARVDVEVRPPVAVDTDADVHISQSAIPFPRWHLDPEWLATLKYPPNADGSEPDEYRSPLMVAEPQRPLETVEEEGPDTSAPHTRIVECIRLARSMIPEVPVKPKDARGAAPAGTLGYVKYPPRGTEGWMYVEDTKSDYGTWFQELIHRKYTDAKALFEKLSADNATSPAKRGAARDGMRHAAACIAISNQEGAPSAINTYDGLVLSWGIGIAGPGLLPKTFHTILKDPRVYKAFYLCGFRYDGVVFGTEYHGAYQIVDLCGTPPEDKANAPPARPQPPPPPPPPPDKKFDPTAPVKPAKVPPTPAVVHRDQWKHGAKQKPRHYSSFDGNAYKVLKYVTSQPKLVHLLIQLAKDPMTRSVIFEPNYQMIQGFANFVGPEEIHTEALHIFASLLKQNWGLGPEIVRWAVSRFSSEERRVLPPPGQTSEEKDRAIAKGLVRFVMGRLQEQRWAKGVQRLVLESKGKLQAAVPSARDAFLYRIPATTEYGLQRLIDYYLKPLAEGPHALTKTPVTKGPGISLPGFPAEVSGPISGRYVWIQQPDAPTGAPAATRRYYDLGPLSQFDLLFPHEEIRLIDFTDGLVEIDDNGQRRTVPRDLRPTRGGVR